MNNPPKCLRKCLDSVKSNKINTSSEKWWSLWAKKLSGFVCAMYLLKNIFYSKYQNNTSWQSLFWQNPTKITLAQKFENHNDVEKVAKIGVPYFHILDITGGVYFIPLTDIGNIIQIICTQYLWPVNKWKSYLRC